MNIKQTIAFENVLQVYNDNEMDNSIIKNICFATNIAEKVAVHFNNTFNKVEFYRAILNDDTLKNTMAQDEVKKHYGFLCM